LNAVTREVLTITNDHYINSQSVCQLLLKIADAVGHGAITLVLDNARYQKCKLVQDYAEILGIELLFLPAYSPNLNLIERFWKFVKQDCLYSKYYKGFDEFKAAISACIKNAHHKNPEALKSLLSWNFQLFSKTAISTV
jgi:transposase